ADAVLGAEVGDGGDDDAAVPAAQIINHVVPGHFRELAHAVDHVVRRRHVANFDMVAVLRIFLAEIDDDGFARLGSDLPRAIELRVVVGAPGGGHFVNVFVLWHGWGDDLARGPLALYRLTIDEHTHFLIGRHQHL